MAKSHPEEEEVIDISSSEDDDDRIEAFAEAMNTVPVAVDPVTVVDLQNNPSGQSTFQLSKKVKSRSATSGSPKEHKFSGVVVTPKITSHFMPSSSARRNLASSAQRQIKRKSSSTLDACNQPVRISIPMGGGRQELKIQIGDKKLRRDSNNEKKMKCPPKVQQADSMPEVVLLSDDDDDDDTVGQVDADRQFTAAIEESIRLDALKKVKEALKRKVEGTTTTTPTSAAPPEGERRKRAKLEPVAAEEYDYDPARYEVDNAYAALLHVIRSKVKDGEYVAIEKKMEKRKAGIKTEHLRSITLKEFLEIKRNQIRKETTGNPFKYIQSVLDELRRYSKPANSATTVKLEPVAGTSSNTEPFTSKPDNETTSKDRKKTASQKHIRKLEKALENCAKEIRKLEAADDYDYDLEIFDDTASTYMKLDRYRKRAVVIYQRLSELKEFDASLGRRQDKKFKLEGSRYPEINTKIAKFVNRSRSLGPLGLHKVMPNFDDIHKLIKATNEEKELGLSAAVIMSEAQETFQAVGEKLASRRIYDEMVDREGYMPEDAAEGVDPADNDEEMAKKLGGEKRLREEERKVRHFSPVFLTFPT